MELNQLISYMADYGLIFIAVIIFLEYLNLPGFPAGIILPVAGVWAAGSGIGFIVALVVSIASALLASWALYALGWYGGEYIIGKYTKKFPKQKAKIEDIMAYLGKKGNLGVFVSKLIPMVRTIIGVPAGVLRLNFWKYTICSALGIAIWNGVLMSTGYFLGQEVLNKFI